MELLKFAISYDIGLINGNLRPLVAYGLSYLNLVKVEKSRQEKDDQNDQQRRDQYFKVELLEFHQFS